MEYRTRMTIRSRITGQLILGISIAVIGVLFTLDNLHILRARDFLQFWPVVLIAIGVVHVAQARTASGVTGGAIWIFVGVVLLGNRLGFLHVRIWNYWPLLLVLVGGRIVMQAISGGGRGAVKLGGEGRDTRWSSMGSQTSVGGNLEGGDPSSIVSAVAVMGGFDRRITSREFRGGELTAFMGGGKLDLRDTVLADNHAEINIFSMMGGFEIRVPESWSVVCEVTPFMGGVEDKARISSDPAAPRLVIRGFVMMSSLELTN
jgi:predicted membrane protein